MRIAAFLAALLLSLTAEAAIFKNAKWTPHHPQGQPNVIDRVNIDCILYNTAPATGYQTISGFGQECHLIRATGYPSDTNYGWYLSGSLTAPGHYYNVSFGDVWYCIENPWFYVHMKVDVFMQDLSTQHLDTDSNLGPGFCFC